MTATSRGTLVLAVVLAAALLAAGGMKLAGRGVEPFEGWGYPGWFSYVTAMMEVAAAMLLLLRATRFWGATLALAVMFGAAATHFYHGEIMQSPPALILLAIASRVCWATLPSRLENQPPAGSPGSGGV